MESGAEQESVASARPKPAKGGPRPERREAVRRSAVIPLGELRLSESLRSQCAEGGALPQELGAAELTGHLTSPASQVQITALAERDQRFQADRLHRAQPVRSRSSTERRSSRMRSLSVVYASRFGNRFRISGQFR